MLPLFETVARRDEAAERTEVKSVGLLSERETEFGDSIGSG